MNNAVFRKTMENMRKHRNIKHIIQKKKKLLAVRKNHQTTKFFTENLLAMEMKKIQILMNKPVSLGLPILELSKILMYEFCYDYVKPKHGEISKLCYMYTNSSIVYIKTNDVYKDIAQDVETRFDTSNYELDRPLPTGKN